MHIQHHQLRTFRTRSPLFQSDIAAILGHRDDSTVCRWERGDRTPSIDMILAYHILFDVPVEAVLEREKRELMTDMVDRIAVLLESLRTQSGERHLKERIAFLEAALRRIDDLSFE